MSFFNQLNKRSSPDVKARVTPDGQFPKQFSQSCQCHRNTEHQQLEEQLEELIICSLNTGVMVLQSVIDNRPSRSLLDSGASGNFLTGQFINKFNIPTKTVSSKAVRLADGKLLRTNQMVVNVPTTVNGKTVKCNFIVL